MVAVTVGVSTSRSGWGHGHGQHWVAIEAVGRQEAAADPSVTGAGNTAAGVRPVATGKVQGAGTSPAVWVIRDSGKLGPDKRGNQAMDEAIALK